MENLHPKRSHTFCSQGRPTLLNRTGSLEAVRVDLTTSWLFRVISTEICDMNWTSALWIDAVRKTQTWQMKKCRKTWNPAKTHPKRPKIHQHNCHNWIQHFIKSKKTTWQIHQEFHEGNNTLVPRRCHVTPRRRSSFNPSLSLGDPVIFGLQKMQSFGGLNRYEQIELGKTWSKGFF